MERSGEIGFCHRYLATKGNKVRQGWLAWAGTERVERRRGGVSRVLGEPAGLVEGLEVRGEKWELPLTPESDLGTKVSNQEEQGGAGSETAPLGMSSV